MIEQVHITPNPPASGNAASTLSLRICGGAPLMRIVMRLNRWSGCLQELEMARMTE
jgi:hypothetical protein